MCEAEGTDPLSALLSTAYLAPFPGSGVQRPWKRCSLCAVGVLAVEQQAGLFRPDLVVIHHRTSVLRVRVSLKDLAGDLSHGAPVGE